MKKVYLYKLWWFWAVIIALFVGSAILIAFADELSPNHAAMWAGIISAGSTALLGGIAIWQNIRQQNDNVENQSILQRMEENNFIANFSSMILLDRISFDFPSGNQVNYNLHAEQLLQIENDADNTLGCPAIAIIFVMKRINDSIPTLVKVDRIVLFADAEKVDSTTLYVAQNFRDGFSSIAIKNEELLFSAKVLMTAGRIKTLKSELDALDKRVFIQAKLTLVSAEAVATECTCRSYLVAGDWDEKQSIYCSFRTTPNHQPTTFIDNRYIIRDRIVRLDLETSKK